MVLFLEPFYLSTRLFLKLHYNWANNEIWTRDLFLTKETLYPWAISAEKVERETRVELATFSLEGWRSTNWATPALICGESRIRTYEGVANSFTDCSRWPLEYPTPNTISIHIKNWEPMEGLEPTTCWLQISCSSQLSYIGNFSFFYCIKKQPP